MTDYDSNRLKTVLGAAIKHHHWRLAHNVAAELAVRFPFSGRAASVADKYLPREGAQR